ncbi:GNAT family N-acetyltransferase [Hoeflea sp. TYP-13]|uniref:GNAT family N-acetyltransferase n=1 Tax=Hoeflea sp. TYP-13 TaxID=3230023 RepID=UPI0034C69C93
MARTSPPLRAVVTYLEQLSRPTLLSPMPVNLHVAIMKQSEMPLHFYRYLQFQIGREWHWVARLRLSDDALSKIIHDPKTSIHVLYLNGAPSGFFELHQSDPETVNLEYFGMMPHAHGRGLGRWFLSQALEAAWEPSPLKVTVNTCTLDHPAALPLYQKLGFNPIGQSETFIHPLTDADLIRIAQSR